jgi:hypothetical protein
MTSKYARNAWSTSQVITNPDIGLITNVIHGPKGAITAPFANKQQMIQYVWSYLGCTYPLVDPADVDTLLSRYFPNYPNNADGSVITGADLLNAFSTLATQTLTPNVVCNTDDAVYANYCSCGICPLAEQPTLCNTLTTSDFSTSVQAVTTNILPWACLGDADCINTNANTVTAVTSASRPPAFAWLQLYGEETSCSDDIVNPSQHRCFSNTNSQLPGGRNVWDPTLPSGTSLAITSSLALQQAGYANPVLPTPSVNQYYLMPPSNETGLTCSGNIAMYNNKQLATVFCAGDTGSCTFTPSDGPDCQSCYNTLLNYNVASAYPGGYAPDGALPCYPGTVPVAVSDAFVYLGPNPAGGGNYYGTLQQCLPIGGTGDCTGASLGYEFPIGENSGLGCNCFAGYVWNGVEGVDAACVVDPSYKIASPCNGSLNSASTCCTVGAAIGVPDNSCGGSNVLGPYLFVQNKYPSTYSAGGGQFCGAGCFTPCTSTDDCQRIYQSDSVTCASYPFMSPSGDGVSFFTHNVCLPTGYDDVQDAAWAIVTNPALAQYPNLSLL